MKVLGGGGGINDLKIIPDCAHQKAFEPGAGMLRALSFESVRQEQYQSAQSLPFLLGAGDELVHNRLGRIPEVAKLRLPED